MSEQRIDTGADAATGTDADPGEGLGPGDPGTAGSSTERTGEVGSAPREHRREVDPGSVATEFGDRADEAPDDDVAHPSI